METLYITHPACRLHEMGPRHPECPERLDAISDQLLIHGLMDFLSPRTARLAGDEDMLRVHRAEYLAALWRAAPAEGYAMIDPDTAMNPHTFEAAQAAAGAGLTAIDAVMGGEARTAFCAVRPPGHHARPAQAMGFCFVNNIAVAAAYALERHALDRVAIIDFDVHHGNGTEEIFLRDERVLMCSFYQRPLFPDMWASDPGSNMINVPVPPYAEASVCRDIVTDCWLPALRAFRPELILVSAGFDGHREDEMGQLKLTEADYAWITRELLEVAHGCAQGRIVSFLEGGYNLSALGRSVAAHIRALGGL
ncbi:histone deacetylase family protein [Castellaniella sp. GW247-6E4]|uniref:histone deacetylase family protein n=1 Tax=Castellaniella sp. GW247-6E4 TaxID=3140380 RepID=UPI003315DE2C